MSSRSLSAALVLSLTWAAASPAQTVSNSDMFGKSLQAAQEALRHFGAYDDPDESQRVADIGYRVVAASGFTKYPITFHLIDMPEPNAFALPGGHIFVTRGMLELGLSDDMLACLLGHEIAHVVLEHGIKMERRATLLNVLSQAALVGVIMTADQNRRNPQNPVDPRLDPNYSDSSGDLIQGTAAAGLVLSELLLRSYSREFEDQSDEEGQRWAAGAGFQPTGTRDLFALMNSRLPQDKKYGYWQTHPFFDSRAQAAIARGELLKAQPEKPADDLRQKTQAALLSWLAAAPPEKHPEPDPMAGPPPGTEPDGQMRLEVGARTFGRESMIKHEALGAWPQGPVAEGLRFERLHELRDAEIGRTRLARDYGRLIADYDRQIEQIRALTPDSPALKTLDGERSALRRESDALLPEAQAVLASGIYETSFLETFLSNWPQSPEVATVSLALGEAYSRLGRPADAVAYYLRAGDAKGTEAARRALAGLRNLAPYLDDLAALQQLAEQTEDEQLAQLAAKRLSAQVPTFTDLSAGAAYLRRYPTGPHAAAVGDRLNVLAQNLYGEMVLYQAIGDSVKALDRIQKILTFAPSSPAAGRLRERTVLQS